MLRELETFLGSSAFPSPPLVFLSVVSPSPPVHRYHPTPFQKGTTDGGPSSRLLYVREEVLTYCVQL